MTLTFWGHVTLSVMRPLDSQYMVCYGLGSQWSWSVESKGITTKSAYCYALLIFNFQSQAKAHFYADLSECGFPKRFIGYSSTMGF